MTATLTNQMTRHSVLVLNKNWQPIEIASLQDALTKVINTYNNGKPKAHIIDCANDFQTMTWDDWSKIKPQEGERICRSVNASYRVPEVIQLTKYDKLPHRKVQFSRRVIYKRDNYTCFVPETLILMSNLSLKPIFEIEIGDKILDAYGKEQVVEFVHARKANQGEMLSIKHRCNGDALICTKNHKILEFDNRGLKDSNGIKAESLSTHHRVAEIVPEIENSIEEIDLSKFLELDYVKTGELKIKHYCGNPVKRFISMNSSFGILAGYYLAEGSACKGNLTFSLHSNEVVFANEIRKLIYDIFGVDSVWKTDGNSGVVICSSTVLVSLFSKLFGTANQKHIGFKNNKEFLSGLLYGVCRGDGTFNNEYYRCTVQMSRPSLIRDLYLVSLLLGLRPSLSKTGQRDDGRIYKSINFNATEFNKICKLCLVPFKEWQSGTENHKKDRKEIDRYLVSKITEIKSIDYEGDVYDLQVSGSHTYIANFVCVHNCQYCGGRPGSELLNLDHIVPTARGGLSTWTNCVISCIPCNTKKGCRTPEEAGMKLRRTPFKPDYNFAIGKFRLESWRNFVSAAYWNVELENDNRD